MGAARPDGCQAGAADFACLDAACAVAGRGGTPLALHMACRTQDRRLPIRLLPVAALLPLAAACAATPEPAAVPEAEPRPVLFRVDLLGKTGLVLDPSGRGSIEVRREGAEPVSLDFANGAEARGELAPGAYSVTGLGGLVCSGVGFAVEDGTTPLALGTLRATVFETDYVIALPAPPGTVPAQAGTIPAAEPIRADRRALCHSGRPAAEPPGREMTAGEEALLGLAWIALCALAVAAGGFCAF